MLDPTHKESLYKRSVRKWLLYELETLRGKKVFFDRVYHIPKNSSGNYLNEWMIVNFNGVNIDNLSVGVLEVNCFSRDDPGNDLLTGLRDILVDICVDPLMPDGCKRVPYYNESDVQIGGMVAFIDTRGEDFFGADGTSFRTVNITLKWGAK